MWRRPRGRRTPSLDPWVGAVYDVTNINLTSSVNIPAVPHDPGGKECHSVQALKDRVGGDRRQRGSLEEMEETQGEAYTNPRSMGILYV